MAKKPTKSKVKSFEESLWDSANKLRGSVEPSEYKHIVLSLVFLKFIGDLYDAQRSKIIEAYGIQFVDRKEFYQKDNVFFLVEEARWSYIVKNSKQTDISIKIDKALTEIEKNNKSLQGALPENYFSRMQIPANKMSSLIDVVNDIESVHNYHEDLIGRIYEYFLSNFALAEGKGKGEFYTPKSIVDLIAELIQPFQGKIYDPCCGSGGMFVQSIKFVENHKGSKKNISIYGQEQTTTTYKLAKMNLAIRGLSANLGQVATDTLHNDQHKDEKFDFIMANPPFNQKDWRSEKELTNDPRWSAYAIPPKSNANYAWILHMVSKLSQNGVAGFILSNGALSATGVELEIRKKLIENDLVEAIIVLPMDMFYTTDISVSLWIVSRNKKERVVIDEDSTNTLRDRSNEVLFIDARNCGEIYQKKFIQIVEKDIELISNIYSNWKYKHLYTNYQDIDELCYSANIDEIQKKNFSLVPSNYIKFNERDIFNDIEDNLDSYKKNILSSLENDIKINQNLINTILGESNK